MGLPLSLHLYQTLSHYLQSNYLQSSTIGTAATYSLNLQLIDTMAIDLRSKTC
ncbi:hypothetical protein [Escherichia phage TM1]|uniref:Uncharacterized protein n=1 Tax=Escherichia phage TM1 TaxID=2762279 RepID=A0ABY4XT47_9CAUD|nr:hypothetical protein [Escherichia phage TM1]